MKAAEGQSVFEKYASEYDIITNAARREPGHRAEVAALMDRFGPRRVLDAGCAVGLTARLFAEQGAAAVGLDRSRAMIRIARRRHAESPLPLRFMEGRFESLPRALDGRFDLVVCLAASIAGVETAARLRRSLRGFRRVLSPGGALVLQTIDPDSVPADGLLPIKGTTCEGLVYERFWERQGNGVAVYVTRLDLNARPPSLEVYRSRVRLFAADALAAELAAAGFGGIRRYADLFLRRRPSRKQRDLVMVAQRLG